MGRVAWEPRGGNAQPAAVGTAMGPTRATWSPPLGALRISRSEDDRAGAFQTQVFERYARSEPEVAEKLLGVAGSRQHGESSQSHPNRAIGSVARALPASPLPCGVRRTLIHFPVRHG